MAWGPVTIGGQSFSSTTFERFGYAQELGRLLAALGPALAGAEAAMSDFALSAVEPRDPTSGDDTADGYKVFSLWMNSVTRECFICVSNSAGAAVWLPMVYRPGLPYRAGLWYGRRGAHTSGNIVPATNTLYLRRVEVRERVTIAALGFRVVTAGVSSAVKMAAYRAGANGMPIGAPIVADNTGVATVTAGAHVSTALTGIIDPPYVWLADVHTGPTLPIPIGLGTTDYNEESQLGRSNMGSNTALVGYSIAHTYANPLPTFLGSESWTEVVIPGMPNMCFQAA